MERFEKGQQVTLKLNPYAHRKPVYFDEINFMTVKDDATRIIQLAKGAIDIVDPVASSVDDWLAVQPGVKIVVGLSPTVAFLHMNNERPLFRDVRVRRAISLAIDRELIGKALYKGRTSLLHGVLPAGVPGHDGTLALPRYDPPLARALLREAGVAPGTQIKFTVVGDGNSASSKSSSQARCPHRALPRARGALPRTRGALIVPSPKGRRLG